ncbi:hypothetical protein [Streptomyces sp. NPDC002763]|uniref:hypothetical protein n=1 Tax=Streptomyces sp. NPDC002763 TaxID=3154427 RepID=UPI0033264250
MSAGEVPLSRFLEEQLKNAQHALDDLGSAIRESEYDALLSGVQVAASSLDECRQELEARLRKEVRSKRWGKTTAELLQKLHAMVAKGGIRPKLRALLITVGMALEGRRGVTGTQLVNANHRTIGVEIGKAVEDVEREMDDIRDTLEDVLDGVKEALEEERSSGRESRASTARRAEVRLLLPPERDESA